MKRYSFLLLFSFFLAAMVSSISFSDMNMKVNGYLQARYTMSQSASDEASIPRLRADIFGDINPNVGYFIELDAVADPVLIYGWVDLKYLPRTTLRVGRFYYPFGLEYTTPPKDFDTINPSSTLWSLFGYSRDIGIWLKNDFGSLKIDLALVNGSDNSLKDTDGNKDFCGRLLFSPLKDLRVGGSYYNSNVKQVGDIELNWQRGAFSLKGEYVTGKVSDVKKTGWYLQPAWFFSRVAQGLVRYEDWDQDTETAGNRSLTTTIGINWYFSKDTKLQLNYEIKTEEGAQIENNSFLTQLQVNF